MRSYRVLAAVVIGVLASSEIALRLAGAIDFPVYDADARTGYIPSASQSGSFLNSRAFAINSEHMGTASPFEPSGSVDILLVGDSIVWGGNSYAAHERLAPQLEAASKADIWPISAGSWALVNQLNYLEDHPDVVAGTDRIVFILNEGDFGRPSSWRDPIAHPRKRPISALGFYVAKYILRPQAPPTPTELFVPADEPFAKLAAFLTDCSCTADFWLYPSKAEIEGKSDQPMTSAWRLDLITKSGVSSDRIYLVREVPGWGVGLYKDSIHPTPAGFQLLAQAIAAALP